MPFFICNYYVLKFLPLMKGHAPGGGCLIALSCDYRVMGPDYLIGYNESKGVSIFLFKGYTAKTFC